MKQLVFGDQLTNLTPSTDLLVADNVINCTLSFSLNCTSRLPSLVSNIMFPLVCGAYNLQVKI